QQFEIYSLSFLYPFSFFTFHEFWKTDMTSICSTSLPLEGDCNAQAKREQLKTGHLRIIGYCFRVGDSRNFVRTPTTPHFARRGCFPQRIENGWSA
ncbi:MAG: hypothetical protein WBW58_01080, partial [Candidatus Acidiferrum sp.]